MYKQVYEICRTGNVNKKKKKEKKRWKCNSYNLQTYFYHPASELHSFLSQWSNPASQPLSVCEKIISILLSTVTTMHTENVRASMWNWTFFGESFLTFLASSLMGCSGIEGGGGEACTTVELLRSLPPEWVEDSEVVRERRPDDWMTENTDINEMHRPPDTASFNHHIIFF